MLLRPGARRVALVGLVVFAVAIGLVAIRSQAVTDGLKFLGAGHHDTNAGVDIQSYRQRTLLAYIGGRIFLDHPVLGVGWQGSADEYAYSPYVADAKRRFVQPERAFPSPAHPWGVQNAYVQSLADLGVAGLVALLAALVVPIAFAVRRGAGDARVAAPALILVAFGAWNGYGLTAGVPLGRSDLARRRRRRARRVASRTADGRRVGCARDGPEDQLAWEKPARAVHLRARLVNPPTTRGLARSRG